MAGQFRPYRQIIDILAETGLADGLGVC